MENLTDDAILGILMSISNFDDLDNMCKGSKRIQDLCKGYRQNICKALLKNLGYTNYSQITESPCKLMLDIRSLKKKVDKKTFRSFIIGTKYKNHQLARFLAINNKIKDTILYDICVEIIQDNNFKNLKTFHEVTGFNFKTPQNQQTLMNLAASWGNGYNDISIMKYMLENGGDLDELDYSEDWKDWIHFSEYKPFIKKDVDDKYFIKARDLIKINSDISYPPLLELLKNK